MSLLVIDIGSSSVRAVLFDARARAIPGVVSSRPHQFITEPPGAAIATAAHLRGLVEDCLDELLQHPAAAPPAKIEAVGMATFAGNLLGVDSDNQPLTPVYSYADTRSAPDVATLRHQLNEAEMQQRTGCRLHTAYHPARLRWLHRTQPALFEKTATWLDVGSWLYRCWLGAQTPVGSSPASWSGLLNRATLAWDERWLARLPLTEAQLPPPADFSTVQQGLTADYAARWPALRNARFFLPLGDGAAANIGLGAVDGGRLGLTVGTTAALRLVVAAKTPPQVPTGLWSYRLDAERHLLGGATSEGGNIFRWARATLKLPPAAEIEAHLAGAAPDGHGLTFLPLLAGERSPGWAETASGGVTGLRLATTPLDILQAALEGVALRLALIAQQLEPLLPAAVMVMAGGGALTASSAWTQIIANALNRPLHLVDVPESTARGVALLLAQALGRSLPEPPPVAATFQPQPAAVVALQAAQERQVALYRQTVEARP